MANLVVDPRAKGWKLPGMLTRAVRAAMCSVVEELIEPRFEEMRKEIGSFRAEMISQITETREQIGTHRAETREQIAETRNHIGSFREDMKEQIGSLRGEMRERDDALLAEIKELKVDTKRGFERLDHRVDELAKQIVAVALSRR